MLTLEGPAGPVTALAFSPAGDTLAVAGKADSVRLWDPPADAGDLGQHAGGITALAFSPDGHYLATGGIDRMLKVWDVRERRLLAGPPPLTESISAVAFVGPGRVVFGIGERSRQVARSSTLFRLDLPNGKPQTMSFGVVNGVRALAALPDRHLAAWATDTKVLHVQDVTRPRGKPVVLKNDCRTLALSADGRRLAVTSDREVLVFNLDRWGEDRGATLGRHLGQVSALAFSPDGRTLYTGAWDNAVRVWDVDHLTERASFSWPVGTRVTALAVSGDGLRAAAGGDSGAVAVWDLD
jgi:WD40 repeat protein